MKKIIVVIFLLVSTGVFADNSDKTIVSKNELTKEERRAESGRLISRLHEIHDITKTRQLSNAEKIELRGEVKYIEDRLEKMGGVFIYFSVTTLIIILLLILLL